MNKRILVCLPLLCVLLFTTCTKPTKACFTHMLLNTSTHSVQFDAVCSQSSSIFEWSFGDTTVNSVTTNDTITHHYMQAGSYLVTLHVTRKDGVTLGKDVYEASHQITVP